MNTSIHCKSCENHLFNIESGVSCGLTKTKPNFTVKCPDIKFGDSLESKLEEAYIKLSIVESTKRLSLINLVVFACLSFGIMAFAYYFSTNLWDKGFISAVPLIIFAVGIAVLPFAFGPINKFRQEYSTALKAISRLDDMLKIYGIETSINVQIISDNKDLVETKTELELIKDGISLGKVYRNKTTNKFKVRGRSKEG